MVYVDILCIARVHREPMPQMDSVGIILSGGNTPREPRRKIIGKILPGECHRENAFGGIFSGRSYIGGTLSGESCRRNILGRILGRECSWKNLTGEIMACKDAPVTQGRTKQGAGEIPINNIPFTNYFATQTPQRPEDDFRTNTERAAPQPRAQESPLSKKRQNSSTARPTHNIGKCKNIYFSLEWVIDRREVFQTEHQIFRD